MVGRTANTARPPRAAAHIRARRGRSATGWAALAWSIALAALAALTACQANSEPARVPAVSPTAAQTQADVETWRAVLASPGGELPFLIEIRAGMASAVNGPERVQLGPVTRAGDRITIAAPHYDAQLEAQLAPGGDSARGEWRKTAPGGVSRLPLQLTRNAMERFAPLDPTRRAAAQTPAQLAARYRVEFRDDTETFAAVGEFAQVDAVVTGTFLTTTGDYRYLAGRMDGTLLRLSAFDAAHAFLFQARRGEDGMLTGDFWSRDSYHATWTATPDPDARLPDAYAQVRMEQPEQTLAFTFPDLDGKPVSLDDERFRGKVVVAELFGTWCPNCNDAAPLLAEWHRRYRERGLEVVGLAYEYTGDATRDRAMLAVHRDKYGIEYPLLLAGTSDKQAAAATLPGLSAVKAFPTMIFLDRDHRVRAIHSGFAGPGTGEHYAEMVAELEGRVERMLAH